MFATQVINPLGAEAELHKMFKHKREIREWFSLSPHEVNRTIKAIQLLNADLVACEYDVSVEDSRLTDNEIANDLCEAIDKVGSGDSDVVETEKTDPLESLLDAIWLCCKKENEWISVRSVQRKNLSSLKGKTAKNIYEYLKLL